MPKSGKHAKVKTKEVVLVEPVAEGVSEPQSLSPKEEKRNRRRLLLDAYPPRGIHMHFFNKRTPMEKSNYIVSIRDGKLVKK